MQARNFAKICGILFIAIGVLGFIPGIVTSPVTQPDPPMVVNLGYGYLAGLFPVNVLHNLVHLGVGFWGITSARSPKASLIYCQGLSIFYGLLAVLGLMPVAGTTMGLIPIFGNDVLLHLATAAIAGYYGFVVVPGATEAVQEEKRHSSTSMP
ncbi:MAG: hypothetical protein Kow00121_21480 [Elainellaceae cyanobacterium]